MQIKQFTGDSLEELLPQIRADLGDEAVILQTKRVVRGGIGGFFGREGIEVTAAEGVPEDEIEQDPRSMVRSVDLIDEDDPPALANRRAAITEPSDLDTAPPPAFSQHLSSRLSAAYEAEDTPEIVFPARRRAPFDPGGRERTQALIESAREAMRQASVTADPAAARRQAEVEAEELHRAELELAERYRAEVEAAGTTAPAPARGRRGRSDDGGRGGFRLGRVIRSLGGEPEDAGRRAPRADGADPRTEPEPWSPPRITRESLSPESTGEISLTEIAREIRADRVARGIPEETVPEAPEPVAADTAAAGAVIPEPEEPATAAAPDDERLIEEIVPEERTAPEAAVAPVAQPPVAAPAPATPSPAPAASGGVAAMMGALSVITGAAPAPASAAPALVNGTASAPVRPAAPADGPLAELRSELIEAGVEPRYADPLLDGFRRAAMPFIEPGEDPRPHLATWIANRLPLVRDMTAAGPGRAVAFVGQTGVGKTTTACKLVAATVRAGQTATLVLAGEGPHHAAQGLAGELGLEVVMAPDAAALVRLRAELADRDLLVVDTSGRSHQRPEEVEALANLLRDADIEDVNLVLPAGAALADMGSLARRFRLVGVTAITVTKLDETRLSGNLINYPMRIGIPLGLVADGPRVPGDLRPADGIEIARRLLP